VDVCPTLPTRLGYPGGKQCHICGKAVDWLLPSVEIARFRLTLLAQGFDPFSRPFAWEYAVAVVTDLVEIRRLGLAKKDENLGFRRYLSAQHRRIEELQSLAAQIQPRIDCTACANCCRWSVVEVHRGDVDALASSFGVSFEEATRAYTCLDREDPGTRILKNARGQCVFLRGNRCSVYPDRPKTCRDFPHLSFGSHSLGSRISSLARWIPLCPIIYNAFESYKRAVGYHPPDRDACRRLPE
jgi:uncharacterized protein